MDTLLTLPSKFEKPILSVDLGGTKTAVALINTEGKILISRQETTSQEGPQAGIAQIRRLLDDILLQANLSNKDVLGIGIGIPAVLEPHTDLVIWAPNLEGWRNISLRQALEDYFKLPTCIEYDGHTAVLGEWWQGQGRDFQSVVNIIIGTGVGGGIILDGRLIRGHSRLAGAVGWFVIGNTLIKQEEVKRSLGSWEAHVAGPGIAHLAYHCLEEEPSTTSILRSFKKNITAKEIFEAARKGDLLSLDILHNWAKLVGLGVANVVSLINPEVVILGGGVGSNASDWITAIETTLRQFAQPISAQLVKIKVSTLGSKAGLLGAAYSLYLRYHQNYQQ